MATEQQLIEGLRRADAAGDTQGARAIAAELSRVRSARQRRPAQKPTSFWQGVLDEGGKAINNLNRVGDLISGRGLAKAFTGAPTVSDLGRAQLRQQQANSPYQGSTAGRITGGILAAIPTALIPGGVVAQGAAGGALLSDADSAGGLAKDVALGGVGGKVGQVFGSKVLAPVARRVSQTRAGQAAAGAGRDLVNSARRFTSRQKPTPPRVPAAAPPVPVPTNPIAPLGRRAQIRDARFRASGVARPTTGQVTRDPRVWTAEREIAKRPGIGDEIQQAHADVRQGLYDRSRQIVDDQGGTIGAEASGQRVSDALAAKNQQLGEEVGALYRNVRETMGDVRVPSLENLKAAQAHPDWADNAEFDSMVAALNKRLLRYADADDGVAGLSVKQAEETRKFIAGLGPNNAQGYSMRRVLQDGLDADVLDNVGGAPFAEARAAAAARFAEFKGTYPGRIADEGIPPELLSQRIMNAPISDLRALRASLDTPAGQEAWQGLRAQALDDFFRGGLSNDGSNVAINGKALADRFTKQAPRLREILEPDTYKDVRRLSLAARDAESPPVGSYTNYSNTASAAGADAGSLFGNITEPRALGVAGKTAVRGTAALAGGLLGSFGGPLGNTGGAAGGLAAGMALEKSLLARAQEKYLAQLAEQAALARNPAAAAQALTLPDVDDAARLFAERWGKVGGRIGGPGAVIGGSLLFGP